MAHSPRVHAFVATIALMATAAMTVSWQTRLPFPGFWNLGVFLVVAVLLEQSVTQLKAGVTGSISFVTHLSAGILFGGFWGGLVAGISTALGQLGGRSPVIKVVFNFSQLTLAVSSGLLIYHTLGGSVPPEYLRFTDAVSPDAIRRDLALFFIFAAAYFLINSAAVATVVSLSTGQPFREVWVANTQGVLRYDISASVIALGAAWSFVKSQQLTAIGPLGLVAIIAPVVVVRHVYRMYRRLQDSSRELLEVMVKAIEARDPYTSGHSLRVSALSRAIAVELGLTVREIEEVQTAALLHDVGKIYEEFAPVLRKEGKLTPEETALMQTHSTKSAELVGIISKFRGFIQDSVRHHHERWDGQGYPSGLSGKDIPLGARIILLADTVDAMTTDRPYRKRLGLDVVIAEIQRCKGTQFEPELVDVAISSVAVRRLIVNPVSSAPTQPGESKEALAPRSRRVSWPSGLWPARQG